MIKNEIIGFHTIESILKNTPERAILLTTTNKNKRLKHLIKIAINNNIKVNVIKSKLKRILFNQSFYQNAILTCKPFQYVDFNQQITKKMNLILILDRIQDSQNLGKICRSALCFGVNLIIIPKNNSVKITSIVEQIAVGSLSIIPITQVINITETINKLKKIGFFIIGTETNTHISSYKYTFSNKTALIIGNEELGIRLLIRKTCDQIITIPMRKHNINLNAADATTILLYEINRKYHQKM